MKKNTTFKDESQNTEYKETWRDEYLKWVCGFANAQGGRIYIGIDDNKKVVGVKGSKQLMEDLPNKVSMSMGILVDVNLHKKNSLEYLSIDVKPSSAPIGYKGKFYYRSGSTNQLLNGIVHMPDTVMDYLKGKYLKSYIHFEGLQRIEKLEIPEDGLREILCNAIVHKDYRGVHTQMKVYDDHIRLWNEGGLIDGMTVESLRKEHNSRPRNKLIAQVFYLAGFIETWGRGIWKVDKAFASESLPVPEYEENSGGVVVTMPRDVRDNSLAGDIPQNKGLNEGLNEGLNLSDVEQKIYDLIKSKKQVTSVRILQDTGLSHATIERHIKKLVEKELIKRVGAKKNGYWEVLK